jgi:non-ribosomal peptide synthetase component F/acyl carrier protein
MATSVYDPSSAPTPAHYEEAIAEIWREVLGRTDIDVSDDFFDVDGDSLHAIQVIGRIRETWGVGVRAMDFFEAPTVRALAAAVAVALPSEGPVLGPRGADAEPVLSHDQQRLWFEDQLQTGAAYHVHGRQRLTGPLDVGALDASVRAILGRHEVLRSRFPTVDGHPVQLTDVSVEDWHITVEDLGGPGAGREAAARLMDEEAVRPFDLAHGPLVRCLLLRLAEDEHVLCVTAHHIVCDDWSAALFGRELAALYRAGGDAAEAGLPPLEIQYGDYALWQRRRFVGPLLERDVDYWRQHLDGAPAALALPSRRRRPPHEAPGGGRVRTEFSPAETAGLHDLCHKHGATPFMALLAGFGTVLGRWSGQQDLVIGAPITGRTDPRTEQLIGFFINTLPIRVDLSGAPAFAELLERTRQSTMGGLAHADAPLDVLVGELPAARVPGRTPLFQVILNVVGAVEAEQLDGLFGEMLDAPARTSKFDLSCTAREWDGSLRLELEFDAGRYAPDLLQLLLDQVRGLLRAASEDPSKCVYEYPLALKGDAADAADAAFGSATSGKSAGPGRFTLHDAVAVAGADGAWSYRRLDAAAERVAHRLAELFPLSAGTHLAVVRRPTGGCAAMVLACLRSGTPFSLVDDAPFPLPGITAVLDAHPDGGSQGGSTIDLSPLLEQDAASDGCAGPLQGAGERFAVLSPLPGHFVGALTDALDAGATLVPAHGPSAADPAGALAWLSETGINVLYTNPAVLRALSAAGRATGRAEPLPSLHTAFVQNEGDLLAHDVEALRGLSRGARCVGQYRVGDDGRPAAAYEVPRDWDLETAAHRVPLGLPLRTDVRLENASGTRAGIGEAAEIRVGAERTGDLGRLWPDGVLEFVAGPGDEPGADTAETAAALRALPGVDDAVVAQWPAADGGLRLVGYVAGGGVRTPPGALRQQLVARLPDHLLPDQVIVLARMPLTAEGEYDLAEFPAPDEQTGESDRYVQPRTPMERRLVEILRELLDVERVGIYDTFFELGGFSLLATQLNARIRESIHVELTLREIFESATVDALAQRIVRAQAEQASAEELEALLSELELEAG